MITTTVKLLLFNVFILTFLVLYGCSTQKPVQSKPLPAWVDNPSGTYDEDTYLLAVGSGSTLKEAQEDARGSLSRIFQSEINATQQLIDEFIETSKNDEFSSERSAKLLNMTRIGTNQELMNTQILESDVAGNGTYYALAGMNRSESSRIYNQEISNNELKINEYENNAEKETDVLQKLILLKKALVLARVNENLSRQRNIILRGVSDRELNTMALNRIQEKFRTVREQAPVTIKTENASEIIVSSIAGVFQKAGFSVANGTQQAVLEVNVDYQSQKAELNRENAEFVKWELIINIVNNQSDQSFKTFIVEGRDGALSYADALKRADYAARGKIETDFESFLNQELLALN